MFEKEKQCPSCGKTFDCGGLWFCWCAKVKLDAAARQEIAERYAGCLCRECLERHAASATLDTTPHQDAPR